MASIIASPVNPVQIADHMMNLHVHLRQRFVHMRHVLARHFY